MSKVAVIQDNKIYVCDDRWITINADKEEGRKGQHVLIKENGNIVFGLGGKFKNLKDLGKKNQTWTRDYNCDLALRLGKEHYDGIRYQVENCDNEDLKKMWQKYESKVLVADAHYKGTAYCNLRSIHLDIEKTAKGSWAKMPYETALHESAHAIDFALGEVEAGKGRVEFCIKYKNGLFGKTIAEEINGRIDTLHNEMKTAFKLHGKDIKWLDSHGYLTTMESTWYYKDAIRVGQTLEEPIKYSKKRAYDIFAREVNDAAREVAGEKGNLTHATIDVNDMVEGATKGKIGEGHGAGYWRKPYFTRKGDHAALAIEAFAEMTSATATNPQSLTVIKKILPKSYKVYLEMLAEINKRT